MMSDSQLKPLRNRALAEHLTACENRCYLLLVIVNFYSKSSFIIMGNGLGFTGARRQVSLAPVSRSVSRNWLLVGLICLLLTPCRAQIPWTALRRDKLSTDGVAGLTVTLKQPEGVIARAVQQVADDNVVHGTWVYERDRTLKGARAEKDSAILRGSEGAGETFYKIADRVVAPRFFEGSADVGNITVRYLVAKAGPSTTRLQIDAVFTEYGRKTPHRSTGAVESAEYQAIELALKNIQAAEDQHRPEFGNISSSADLAVPNYGSDSGSNAGPMAMGARPPANFPAPSHEIVQPGTASLGTANLGTANLAAANLGPATVGQLRLQVKDLKRKVEMRVKDSEAPLKASPFSSAATLASLSGHSEVLVLIITRHWYGIETQAGQHGWLHSSQVEPLP